MTSVTQSGAVRQALVRCPRGASKALAGALIFLFILTFWGFALPAAGAGETPAAPQADPFAQVVEHKLTNGLTVLVLREPRAPLVTHQVWYKVGSRQEDLGKTGLSHLTEHLMFKGTDKYGPKEFSRLVQKAGGNENAFTSRDYTAYFQTGPKGELKRWMEMEADRMRGLKVTEEAFQTERRVVLEERRLRTEDDPVNALVEETWAAAFMAHPYQWPVVGWFHDIESLSREDFLKYYQTYYRPNNATVVVVGDVEPKEVVAAAEAVYGSLPQGPEPPRVTAKEPPQQGERRVEVRREAQLPFLVMLYHAPNWESPDCYALEGVARVLSQGRSSRLYQRLVYKERLALDAGADYDLDTANPSAFSLYGQPLPGKTAAEIEKALNQEVQRLQTELVGPQELEKVKNQVAAGFYMGLDSLFFRAMLLGRLATVAKWSLAREFVPKFQAVTAEEIRQAAKKYLVPENRTVGLLNPLKTDKPIGGRYQRGGVVR